MKYIIGILLSVLTSTVLMAQQKVTWEDLQDVDFESKYYEEVDEYLWFPSFGESVAKLVGKEVWIKGFAIPMDAENNIYVVSANPYSSCFFCGNAGPESIVSLKFKKDTKPKMKLDQVITVKGKFRTNSTNIDELNYILDNAEFYTP